MDAPDSTSAELFRKLVASVRDYAIFAIDPAGYVMTWNTGAEQLKGYRADEIIGKHFSIFYPADDVQAGKCELELEIAAREGRFEDEGWRIRKDGTRIWANVVISAMRDGDQLIGFSKVTRDLSERKQAELDRLAAEERYRFLVDSVRDYAIFILDPDGVVATWNAGAERIKGYRASEIIGSHFSRFYPDEDVRNGKCELELELAARDGRFEDEGWRLRKDGSRFWANVVISSIRNPAGVLIGFAKVTRDLTERRQSEEARTALAAAERANRTKDEFLATLGHELRNPLAPISTALELLRSRGGDWPRELEIIDRQTHQLIRLVEALLDVARIGQGKIELVHQRLDLRDALAQAVESAAPLIENRKHRLRVDAMPQPIPLDGDPARLIQIFSNLLNNAAKYMDPGGLVELVVSTTADAAVVEVRDTGVGIDAAFVPHLFESFVQAPQDRQRRAGGLGLGLNLVRSLVELHGGTVRAASRGRGHGSTFTVRLPLAR